MLKQSGNPNTSGSKRTRSKAHIPIHRESLAYILSPVFCLLPRPPILPILPRIHESIMQNKANFLEDNSGATSFATMDYRKNLPCPTRKNKPKQTQFLAAKPCAQPNPPYATRCPLHAMLNTRYKSKNPPHEKPFASSLRHYYHAYRKHSANFSAAHKEGCLWPHRKT